MNERLSKEYEDFVRVWAEAIIASLVSEMPEECPYSQFNLVMNTLATSIVMLAHPTIPKPLREEFVRALAQQIYKSLNLSDMEQEK